MLKTHNTLFSIDFKKAGTVRALIITVDADKARRIREECHFERQRRIRENNVERLSREMISARFIQGTSADIAVLPNGQLFLLNGNHTMEAIAKSGIPTIITFIFHDVKDIDDAGRIYAVMDIHAKRSWADSLKGMDKVDIVPKAGRILSAIGIIERNFEQDRHWGSRLESRIERIDRLDDYKDAAELFVTAVTGGIKDAQEIAWLAPVAAVALYTIRHQAMLATEFWERFAKDDGLRKGDPERALLGWCRNNRGNLSGARQQVLVTCSAAILAWNAKFKDAKLEVVKPTSVRRFVVLGTPLDHGLPNDERAED